MYVVIASSLNIVMLVWTDNGMFYQISLCFTLILNICVCVCVHLHMRIQFYSHAGTYMHLKHGFIYTSTLSSVYTIKYWLSVRLPYEDILHSLTYAGIR